tara:strand:+ start:475 stop:768 length:294 start_codon:yes stop_codon:yes gene_type:complete
METAKIIQIHPRPTVQQIDAVAKDIIEIPSGPERDKRLSQVWFLSMPSVLRNKMWDQQEIKRYFFETQLRYLGWTEDDFSVLHIAVTGETPIFDRHT